MCFLAVAFFNNQLLVWREKKKIGIFFSFLHLDSYELQVKYTLMWENEMKFSHLRMWEFLFLCEAPNVIGTKTEKLTEMIRHDVGRTTTAGGNKGASVAAKVGGNQPRNLTCPRGNKCTLNVSVNLMIYFRCHATQPVFFPKFWSWQWPRRKCRFDTRGMFATSHEITSSPIYKVFMCIHLCLPQIYSSIWKLL